jgi:hypothetical protein
MAGGGISFAIPDVVGTGPLHLDCGLGSPNHQKTETCSASEAAACGNLDHK